MGCPGLSGFFSKDAVLLAAYQSSTWVFLLALLTAFLTAFYMTRLVVVAFLGKARTPEAEHGHDGPAAMTTPLLILAVLSVIAGWPIFSGAVFGHPFMEQMEATAPHSIVVPILAIGAFLVGAFSSWLIYAGAAKDPVLIPVFKNKFYIDEFYGYLVGGTQELLAKACRFFDKIIIDGVLVRGLSGGAWGLGFVLRLFQIGNLQAYAFLFGVGVVGLIYLMVFAK